MAFMNPSFSRSDIPEDEGGGSYEPIPAGTYDVVVQGIDLRKTKAGTGEYLAVRLDVTGPTHQGRHPQPTFKQVRFLTEEGPVLGKSLTTVIAGEYDNGVVPKRMFV